MQNDWITRVLLRTKMDVDRVVKQASQTTKYNMTHIVQTRRDDIRQDYV